MIKNILISQPRPSSEKSPYYDLEKEYGVRRIVCERVSPAENKPA